MKTEKQKPVKQTNLRSEDGAEGKPAKGDIEFVIHELRTPLTVIIGSIYTAMSDGVSPEDRKCLLQNAVQAAESLDKILESLRETPTTNNKSQKTKQAIRKIITKQ